MNGKRQTILVVDDVPDDIAILEEILKKEYQVKAVTSGEAALKIARSENPPDLILLDVIMPVMDGFEVCRNLRQDSDGAMIPIVFLTAKVMTADEKLGFELGAVDYIRKPVDPEIVTTRIKAHLEQKDQVMRSSELRFRRLFETSKDGIMIVDKGTGLVVDVNPSMTAILGLNQEYFLGKRVSELDFLKNILSPEGTFPEMRQCEYVRFKDQPMDTVDGRKIYVEYVYNTYKVNRREVTQLNIRDVTGLIIAQRERDELSSKLSHYLSTSPTVTYSLRIKDGKAPIQWVSENIRNILGFAPDEALEEDWWLRNVHAADKLRAMGGISTITRGGSGSFAHEYRFHKKNREQVWLHDEMRLGQASNGEAEIVGTLTDISDRKAVEAELSLKSIALDAAANAIMITDRGGTIQWVNPAFGTLTGYSREETIGKNPRILSSGLQDASFYRSLWDDIMAGRIWQGRLLNKRKGGEIYTEEMTITPVMTESRSISGFIAIKSDVTEREASRERLESSLKEKEVLLREIHHRINNNMQIINSFLNLSAHQAPDKAQRELIEGVSRRLISMALVHEQFYNSPDMASIDFLLYLHQLADGLHGERRGGKVKIIVDSEDDSLRLSLEQAISAGLAASELITNSLRHAYPGDGEQGSIHVRIRLAQGQFELKVRDEGVGLPEGFDLDAAESLGMVYVRTLAAQLRGKIMFRSDKGTEAILRFPIA
jgi:PAS domain S-box-containing protein